MTVDVKRARTAQDEEAWTAEHSASNDMDRGHTVSCED